MTDAITANGDKCRAVMNAIPVYIWSANADGDVDFVNPQWEEFTGLHAQEAHGWKWRSVIHLEDEPRYIAAWRSSLASAEPLEEEIRVRRHDGVYRWWLIRCTPVYGSRGEVFKWYGAGFDIDDRKQAQEALWLQESVSRNQIEQELRSTIDAIPVLCGTLNSEGNVDYFNRPTLEFYGMSSEQMLGFNWKNVVHPDDLPRLVAAHMETLPAGLPLDIETRCRRADGEYRWLLHRIVPRFDGDGNILKYYGISIDIEDRKRAEEALLEMRVVERTRIARELHDTLLQNFQATLLMMGAATDLAEPGPNRDRLECALRKAEQAISEGRDAIQDLRSKAQPSDEFVPSLRALGQALADNAALDESATFHLEVSGFPVGLRSEVAREALSIGSEAIRNAFRHARANRVSVRVSYDVESFVLTVADDGAGISPQVLAEGGGEGHFGLAGMRERAKIANGQLRAHSELENGTTIELMIPAIYAYAAR